MDESIKRENRLRAVAMAQLHLKVEKHAREQAEKDLKFINAFQPGGVCGSLPKEITDVIKEALLNSAATGASRAFILLLNSKQIKIDIASK